MEQLYKSLIQASAHRRPLLRPRDVADMHLHARGSRPEVDLWRGRNGANLIVAGGTLPLFRRHLGIGFGFLGLRPLDGIEQRVRILIGGHHNLQLVPHPLSTGGEVEEMALDGITVYECYFAPSWMAGIRPVGGFK